MRSWGRWRPSEPSTTTESNAVVERVYYDVRHTLIVNDETDFGVNLEQAGFFVTIGAIPDTVAAELGGDADDLAASVQTITDPGLRTLVVSAVAETPEEATTVTNAFAAALVESLRHEELDKYATQLADAEAEVTKLSDAVALLDDDLDSTEGRIRSLDDQIAGVDSDGNGWSRRRTTSTALTLLRDDLTPTWTWSTSTATPTSPAFRSPSRPRMRSSTRAHPRPP